MTIRQAALGIVFALFSVSTAEAQPVVKENTGDLTYFYPLQIPPARGKVQPTLALGYSLCRAPPDERLIRPSIP